MKAMEHAGATGSVTKILNTEQTVTPVEQKVEENQRDRQRHREKKLLRWCQLRQSGHNSDVHNRLLAPAATSSYSDRTAITNLSNNNN